MLPIEHRLQGVDYIVAAAHHRELRSVENHYSQCEVFVADDRDGRAAVPQQQSSHFGDAGFADSASADCAGTGSAAAVVANLADERKRELIPVVY